MRSPRPARSAARLTALLVTVALLPALQAAGPPAAAPPAAAVDQPRHTAAGTYAATIRRTRFGIPHVVARDYGSLGFGHGYATSETAICVLFDTLLTARGERSRYLGPDEVYDDQAGLRATNLQTDTVVTDMRERRVVERLLRDPRRGPGRQARALVRGYVAGINAYLRSVGGSSGIPDPTCRGARWIRPTVTPLDHWYSLYLAQLLASTNRLLPQIAAATPPANPRGGAAGTDPDARQQQPDPDRLAELVAPADAPFGSNATAVGAAATTTGRGMVLGNPHFPWRGRYRFSQAHLTIPGRYDVAGASLLGSPVINIGFNRRVAWSHTVSTAYRFTPYEYPLVPGSPTTYLTTEGPRELERRTVRVAARRDDGSVEKVTRTLYRTEEGYVVDAPQQLLAWTPASVWAIRDANAEHLRIVDTFHNMAKARNVRHLLAAQDRGAGMPWVNTIAADRKGTVLYADHSVVPNVPDELAGRCLTPTGRALFASAGLPGLDGTRASGECAWRSDDGTRPGVFGPGNLPDTFRRDWVVNANDSYWLPNPNERLEGFARIIGCEECGRSLRTRMVYRYVLDRLDGIDGLARHRRVSPRTLALFQHENRVFGAELARENDDLQTVCEAAEGGRACAVLAGWDGRSDTSSVGTHIFQEFWRRAQNVEGLWEVPFDPADPVDTPRDLAEDDPQVVQAMREALAYLDERDVAYDARWGRLQVAADDGSPPIPVGGGEGYAGNANALSSRSPTTNLDRLYPITYGSSHIQAVSFTGHGVKAETILTYGQSPNPRDRNSFDQTWLFGRERWVDFPFTPGQIRGDLVRAYRVVGRR